MSPTSASSPRPDERSPRARRRLLRWLWLATLVAGAGACSSRDAQVGAGASTSDPDGGIDGGGLDGKLVFISELAADDEQWNVVEGLPDAHVFFGTTPAPQGVHDDNAAVLVFPGDPSQSDATHVGSDVATGIESKASFFHGTFRARVSWPSCFSDEEVVSAASLYFSDGTDGNANGLPDLQELDFQVPCGAPGFVVLTAWSDYQRDAQGRETFRKRAHAVDTAQGDVYETVAVDDPTFTKVGTLPALSGGLATAFPEPGTFYELGISWQTSRVRFFITLEGREVTLWELTDLAYIPRSPLQLVFNLWHPATHWLPTRAAALSPAKETVFLVDSAAWYSS